MLGVVIVACEADSAVVSAVVVSVVVVSPVVASVVVVSVAFRWFALVSVVLTAVDWGGSSY